MKKNIIAVAVAAVLSASASAQNVGFEDGNINGWTGTTTTAVGSTTVQAGSNTWVISPYGSYMGKVQIQSGTYNQMSSALGLTSTSTTAIQTMLNQQAQVSGGNPNPTTAGWITKSVTLTAGTQFTLAWQYVSVDYVPFNDGSIATLTQSGTNTATVNNYNQQYALLGFTNPGTGDYSTGSYGATGWQVATFDVSVDGTYTLGFGVFNMGDTALSPILFIDEVQGTTTKNGQSFGAVAPNNSTAPSSPSSGGGNNTPAPTSTVGAGQTEGTGNLASSVTVNGGTIQVATTGITLTNTFTVGSNGMTVDQNGKTATFNGVISGNGGVTIANSGTGGGITFAAVNTYIGPTTINTGASLTNTGTIAGTVTNSGTFVNSGTAGNTTNSGTATNTGTLGTVTNSGTFNNNSGGTTGSVTNSGTFTNNGTTGSVNNTNTFTNNGTTGGVTNSGTFTNSGTVAQVGDNTGTFTNSGTITGEVQNSSAGTFTNNGTTGNINVNQGVFNNNNTVADVSNEGTFNNAGTAGAVLNSGAFINSGTVTGLFTNSLNGTFTNNGTTGNWLNNSTVTNNGTMADGTNTGTFTNAGTLGDVTNTGTLTTTGNIGSLTNSGTFNYNGGTLGAYTQTGGTTVMFYGTPITVTGAANLGGGLTINNSPTAYGKYPVLSAGAVSGAYDSLTSSGTNDYLKYSGTGVQLYVTPSAAETQTSINSLASSISGMNSLQSSILNSSLGNDSNLYGDKNGSITVNYGNTKVGTGDLNTAGITASKKINDNWRVGVFADQPLNDSTVGGVAQKNNMGFGGFASWNQNADQTGLGIHVSGVQNNGSAMITRNGPESGVGKANTEGKAYQVKATYTKPITDNTSVTPYIGLRHSEVKTGGYTEQGPTFPLTVNSNTQTATDVIAGVSVSHKLTDKLTATGSAGVIQNVSSSTGSLSGTSEIGNKTTFNNALPNNGKTSVGVGAGLSYQVTKNSKVGVNVGFQDKTPSGNNVGYVGLSYTIGF